MHNEKLLRQIRKDAEELVSFVEISRAEVSRLAAEKIRLQAEVERLNSEVIRKSYEVEMHSGLAEGARNQRDTAWNDAIEAAAALVVPWEHPVGVANKILALKRT